ncbi:DeoR/GlpR family DNA-binding transcription regulator [Sediminicola luteus]|uniref:DeoR family transcriptional regulator n=1 Tax=Sediminicola luteus TaxID=319238 RepID=A0A2A4G912_9FLAO|nr:DeoR/GlpR family DNA-binding transcription regulator [Sediminicola luteus]PCE64464.1 DeoR family transcriptional regulator [Sediminicola luteus]
MNKRKRQEIILNEVHVHNRVLLTDLAVMLEVSIDTVRRDVKELHAQDKLVKVHGGAVSKGFTIYADRSREIYGHDQKSIIAKKGIELLTPGDVVLISGGSTNLELARHLPSDLDLKFFTPSLPMAVELLGNEAYNYEVYFIGGKMSPDAQLATGGSSINMLSDIRVDICFLGTGYVDHAKGITEVDWEVAQMKRAMIQAAHKVVSLSISEKLGTFNRYKVCDIHTLDILVTELDPFDPKLEPYRLPNLRLV